MKYNKLFMCLAAVAIIFASCSDPDMGTATPSTQAQSAKVLFINAAPDAVSPALFINNTQAAAPVFPAASGYLSVVAASEQFRIKNAVFGVNGKDTVAMYADLSVNSTLTAPTNYTIIATDSVKRPFTKGTNFSTGPGGLRFLGPLTDDLTVPAAGKAKVRFLHVAPGASGVYVTTASGVLLDPTFTARTYRAISLVVGTVTTDFTKFSTVNAGTTNIELRTTSASGTIIASKTAVTLAEGKIYTIYLSGKSVSGKVKVPYAVNILQHN